ncbi:MAG TPA: MFS transporter [Steroidobacteraceae bacterium]|nr:MFS transporter [Steroidobacteraceae bacterium]
MNVVDRSTADIRQLVAKSRMSAHQLVAIAVCVGLNMLDGFDVLVMSFTAPGVSAEWRLTGSELGFLFSAGLLGMAAGALFLAPRADKFGRRTVVMASVLIVSLGMLFSGFARSYAQLASLRALTGIGIGGILASATVLVAEYSSSRWRSTCSFLYTSGYSLGATIGGAIAAVLIGRFGWRSAFEFGAAASIIMLPVAYWGLPESLDFLIMRQPVDALLKLNRLLAKMRHATVDVLPQYESSAVPGSGSLRRLLTPPLARPTILVWIAFFFMMGGYYFVFSWTPKLLTSSGLTAQQGINSGVLLSLGGIAGTVLFAFVARVVDVRRLTLGCLLASAVLMGLFAMNTTNLPVALIAGVALGGMSTSAMAGFYALTPTLYDADLRASGMGWGIGVGRIGAILAPLATGVLIDHSWHAVPLFYLFAGTFILASLALAGMVPGAGRALPIRAIG